MFSSCILVPEFAILEQVEYICIVGFAHEEPRLCVCCYSELKNWKKNLVHAVFFVRMMLGYAYCFSKLENWKII